MIFALIDYFQYVNMMGKYSIKNLQKEKAILCTKENIKKYFTSSPPNMCLIFLHTRVSLNSWLVMYYTNSLWSHVSCIMDNYVYDTTTSQGFIKIPPSDFIDNKSYFRAISIEIPNYEKGKSYTENLVGKTKYGWKSVIKKFLRIIFGKSRDWRLKFSLDFYFLTVVLYLLNCLSPIITITLICFYSILLSWGLLHHNYKY